MICMQVMDEIAARHGVKVLQHEKPFAGVNGSGKHSNWGLNTDTGKNLFKPGKTEGSQGDFFAFTAALAYAPPRRRPRRPSDAARRGRRYEAETPLPPLAARLSETRARNKRRYAVNHHADVLRCAVTGAGNDHRLGAQEAPPAIISLYTGELMEEHIRNIVKGGPLFGYLTEVWGACSLSLSRG